MRRTIRPLLLLALASSCTCGEEETVATPPATGDVAALFESDGALVAGAGSQDIEVPLSAGTAFEVQLTSSTFDPVLAVQPPGGAVMTNDDWQGSRTEARVRGMAEVAGTLKITITSFDPGAAGAFHVAVRPAMGAATPAPAQRLAAGAPVEGNLATGDSTLPDGRLIDHYVIDCASGSSLELNIEATTDAIPNAILMSPLGQSIGTAENGRYALTQPGPHRLQLISAQPGQAAGYRVTVTQASGAVVPTLARSHHTFPPSLSGAPLQVGQTIQGQLTNAMTLPTGEPATVYEVEAQQGQPLVLEMRSSAFDPYLMLLSPSGQHWENDDHGGTRDAGLDLVAPESGTYRVVATAYRSNMGGAFELKASSERQLAAAAAAPPSGANVETQNGSLGPGDSTITSGEFADAYSFQLTQGERVHFAALSTEFDTYLIVAPPSGDQVDNDDEASPNTNAGVDYVAPMTGSYRVTVTSYQPGETGAYTLEVRRGGGGAAAPSAPAQGGAAPTVATGEAMSGTLQSGDHTLQTGEFADAFTRTFTAGQAVQVRLESTQFDPYLIMTPPGGTQQDNDDLDASTRTAGFDIPSAMAGEYRFVVTSYQPGESGAYTLRFGAGAAAPQANVGATPNGGSAPPAAPGAPRVFGLFAGISDYPDGVGDLPECANDAVKLAEALRNRGLLTEDRQVLLTDAQATRANMLQGLQRLATQMRPTDVFVFFYSGHGGQAAPGSQDTREIDGKDEFLVLHDGQLLDDQLATAFDAVNAGTSLIALDACNSGGFAKDLITRPGRVGLFSSEEDVLSAVAGRFQAGGYLSHFLRTGVMGEADQSPQDRVLTVGELAHFLRLQFSAHAADVQFQGAYQHIVVDRGAVGSNQVLWRY